MNLQLDMYKMNLEQWTRWEFAPDIAGKYDIESLISNIDGLFIRLYSSDNTRKIELAFTPCADAYRQTNESFMFNLPGELDIKYGGDFFAHWTFFKVENSEYLLWLSKQSQGYSTEFDFVHFCLLGEDSVIDIIARREPHIKIF